MAITRVDYDFKLLVTKTIDVNVSGATNPTAYVETANKVKGNLGTGSSPATQAEWVSSRTITSTSEQLNLGALSYGNLPTVDFTTTGTYRLQFYKIASSSNNTTDITIAPSTATGYSIFGTTAGVPIAIGQTIMGFGNGKLGVISSSARLISVTATTSGQAYDIQLIAG